MALDAETAAKWASVAIGAVMAALGLQKWWSRSQQRRVEAENARFAAKADIKELEEVHARISRHKRDSEEQIKKNYNAVLDLYGKHEKTQEKILAAEQRSSDRFETLMNAIAGLKK